MYKTPRFIYYPAVELIFSLFTHTHTVEKSSIQKKLFASEPSHTRARAPSLSTRYGNFIGRKKIIIIIIIKTTRIIPRSRNSNVHRTRRRFYNDRIFSPKHTHTRSSPSSIGCYYYYFLIRTRRRFSRAPSMVCVPSVVISSSSHELSSSATIILFRNYINPCVYTYARHSKNVRNV